MAGIDSPARLPRTAFRTSHLLDFASEKELTAQIGHPPSDWPLVIVKELVDNALDACEEAGIAPEIAVCVNERGITVGDNGPGLPPEVVEGVLDFSVRVSSREAYVAPDRGAQGNALKTLLAMPFALDGNAGRVEVEARGGRHVITFAVHAIRPVPDIRHERQEGLVKTGTRVTVGWPPSASSLLHDAEVHFLQMTADYVWLNPHLTLSTQWFGRVMRIEANMPSWPKWRPSDPTSAHWYEQKHLERLIAAFIAHDEDQGRARPVRELLGEFRGFSGSAAQKRVLDATGLARARLSALRHGKGLDHAHVAKLLQAMQTASRPVKAAQLGILGETHLRRMFEAAGGEMETFQYKHAVAESDGSGGLPWVLEAAFACCPDAPWRRLVTGVNWSPAIDNPFKSLGRLGGSLDGILARQRADPGEPVIVFLHLAHPRVEFTDRGKSAIASTILDAAILTGLVEALTAKWAKQRKAEERHASARLRRAVALVGRREEKITVKQAAYDAIPAAYRKASANNTLPAEARQVMYAARGTIQERTGKPLDDQYFCQTLLPDFIAENPELTAGWKVEFDARGHLIEPHRRWSVPLGTLEVDSYLQGLGDPRWLDPAASMPAIQTSGPSGCYGALLFCEKEGFNELFREVRLAERYDLAIMSTKGVSVTAARRLVDEICTQYQIPLFVLHDFDRSGFTILKTLQCDTRRYTFQNRIEVVDLGLRLIDVQADGLEREEVQYRESPESVREELRKNGASEAEIGFLLTHRVELNAFASDALITWISTKLEEHGVRKVIPDAELLAEAYRCEQQSRHLEEHFPEVVERARRHVEDIEVPADLPDQVAADCGKSRRCHGTRPLRTSPETPWLRVENLLVPASHRQAPGASRGAILPMQAAGTLCNAWPPEAVVPKDSIAAPNDLLRWLALAEPCAGHVMEDSRLTHWF